jgi:hypothetical protein
VFFRSRRARGKPCVAGHGDARTPDPTLQQAQLLQDWRRSAQRVTRAWNAWLAAETRDRTVRYQAFVATLADEERAAVEVERMIELPDAQAGLTTLAPGKSGQCAR